MELVATSKLKRAQDRMVAARPYADAMREVISELVTPELMERFPLLRQPVAPTAGGPSRAVVVLLTSNRGFAGGFNANLIKEAARRVADLEGQGYTVDLLAVGKKGIGYFRYLGRELRGARMDITDRPTTGDAASIADALTEEFAAGRLGVVELVRSQFQSALTTPPVTDRLLPVPPPVAQTGTRADYILSPDPETILADLLPRMVRNAVYRGLVETAAAEQAQRRTAMKNATDNAGDLIESLKRTYNRQRQAQITQEIAELVGGAAALQG
jgi:F-type H+-transporting ATPase subunit gamma